jgi:glycosyltransferase involved in cell wall biosynthesis
MKIVLVGDGESRPAITAAIGLHKVDDMVTMLGWRPNQEVLKLIRSSRALVLPSFAEGLPVVIMESLALRRPVISTFVAGIPELVDESCGWLFPAGDEFELVTAFRKALECTSSELAAKGEAGRARVFERHDRRELAKALYTHFQRISSKPKDIEPRREEIAIS